MPRPCPACGDPLERERTNVTVPRARWGAASWTARWFYCCPTCGREFHGIEDKPDRGRLRLVPLSDDDVHGVDAQAAPWWGDEATS